MTVIGKINVKSISKDPETGVILYNKKPLKVTFPWTKVENIYNSTGVWFIELNLTKPIVKKLNAIQNECKIENKRIDIRLTKEGIQDIFIFDNFTKEQIDLQDYSELIKSNVKPLVRIVGVHPTKNELILKVEQMLVEFDKEIDFEISSEVDFE